MGKVQCSSSKNKISVIEDQLVHNKPRNWHEQMIANEYQRLKDLADNQGQPNIIEVNYGLNNYKVRLNRIVKWSKIVFERPGNTRVESKESRTVRLSYFIIRSRYFRLSGLQLLILHLR